ncbi:MAG TPA: amidohydrolase family protein [Caldilineaceae bacterium]|nr:amidohydrolase family protein [Caldilineaceae bacterium]
MFTFDIHCHFFPQAFLDEARKPGNPFQASIERRADGREHLVCAGNFDHPLTPDFYAAERMLQDMDRWGMRMAGISSAPPTLSYWADPAAARDLAPRINESIAARVKAYPDRFVGLATVPLQDVDASVGELRRAVRELGLGGCMIGSNVNGKNLDHPDFHPFFAAVAELGIPLFIHPYIPAGVERMQDYYLHNLIGMVGETGLAIASVIYGGVLERWPNLKLIFAHAGGVFPYIVGRMDHGYRARERECRAAIPQPPSAYFRQLYFDAITFEPRALRYLVDLVGADHVLIGSDYPFDMGPANPVAEVTENALLTDEEKRQVAGATAAALFGLKIRA